MIQGITVFCLSESGFAGLWRIMEDLLDCDDADASFSPSPLIPLPSRERGIDGCVVLLSPHHSPLDCGSSPQ